MKNINENWIKEGIRNDCVVEKFIGGREELKTLAGIYATVFNGPPFFEKWEMSEARDEIISYMRSDADILVPKYCEQMVGFLVAMDGIPENQRSFVPVKNEEIKFIEEIGVLSNFRGNRIASEMVRMLLLKYLLKSQKYIGYRTNAMRYFYPEKGESFESTAMRIQKSDARSRLYGEEIIIPDLSDSEKQKFINQYVELIKYRPDLDVSNSNALFRSIFGSIEFSSIDGNYSFQKDPTGDGNDRIFPLIDLSEVKVKCLKKEV